MINLNPSNGVNGLMPLGDAPKATPTSATIPMSPTTSKYVGKNGTVLLQAVSKEEEDKVVAGMEKEHVDGGKIKVLLCEPNERVFLHTDGLGPCVAALAYCQLTNGKKLIGCTHIGFQYKDKLLQRLLDTMRGDYYYKGEKIQFYLAGGHNDNDPPHNDTPNSKFHDRSCSFVLNRSQQNICLSGIFFDHYQMTDSMVSKFSYHHTPEELVEALNTDPERYKTMDQEWNESRHVRTLLSSRAGITSEGVVLIRKLVDISFDYDPNKYPDYHALQKHCLSALNLDLSKMQKCSFD